LENVCLKIGGTPVTIRVNHQLLFGKLKVTNLLKKFNRFVIKGSAADNSFWPPTSAASRPA